MVCAGANIAMMSAISALLSALPAGAAEGRTFAVAAGEGGPCAGGALLLRHGSRRHEFPLLPSAAKYPAWRGGVFYLPILFIDPLLLSLLQRVSQRQ